jgi:DNA topoisomerase-1
MKKRKTKPKIKGDLKPEKAAEVAGLEYVSDRKPGITRVKRGKTFKYIGTDGKIIRNSKEIQRINSLAIPPAYQEVWICPKPNGHIQATGRDAKGRKQYRYHAQWKKIRDDTKYTKLIGFAEALPKIRKQVNKHLALSGMPKEKVLAAIVNLLEVTLIRVGNEEYAKENKSFGLTTFQDRHVNVEGAKITFNFLGKSGRHHTIALNDRRLAKIVQHCKDLPGQDLFVYLDENESLVSVSSTDVNEYLKTITNENFTAKDFRTWVGTVLAVLALQEFQQFDSEVEAKQNVVKAIENVAKLLGNTPTICRKCYVHPEVLNAYLDGALINELKKRAETKLVKDLTLLSPEEGVVLAFLKTRLESELKKSN